MERLKERVAHIGQYAVTLLKWMVLGGVIGLVGGIIGSLFTSAWTPPHRCVWPIRGCCT